MIWSLRRRKTSRTCPVGSLTAPHVRRPLDERLAGIERWMAEARRTHRFAPLRDVAELLEQCVSIAV